MSLIQVQRRKHITRENHSGAWIHDYSRIQSFQYVMQVTWSVNSDNSLILWDFRWSWTQASRKPMHSSPRIHDYSLIHFFQWVMQVSPSVSKDNPFILCDKYLVSIRAQSASCRGIYPKSKRNYLPAQLESPCILPPSCNSISCIG